MLQTTTLGDDAVLRIGYLVNHYPKVSHSFIRREIQALERSGVEVERFSIRGKNDDLVDAEDRRERARTRYLLGAGWVGLLRGAAWALFRRPRAFLRGVGLALSMSRGAERPWLYHLAFLAEACVLLSWLDKRPIRHLHAHFGTNSAEVAQLLFCLGGPPFSFTVHGPEEFDKPLALGLDRKTSDARFVVAVSSFGRSQLLRWVKYDDWRKIEIVHCGLDAAFHDGPAVAVPATPRFVCVGRLCEQKGQLVLLEACALLRARGVSFEVVLAGDGEMRPILERRIAEARLAENVRITGWISGEQVRSEILGARALVLPSFAEGLPVAIMEALSLRRPVISTYIAGIPELVRPGQEGWLVPAGDSSALADALEACLGMGEAALEEMSRRGRARVLERHDIDREALKLRALFEPERGNAA
jgi:glycosyltransferase involved in cell wall biosynthesis